MIYAIESGENGPVKIGRGANPEERCRALQTGNPAELTWIASIEVSDVPFSEVEMETLIHGILADSWIRGEWFEATPETILLVHLMRSPDASIRVVATAAQMAGFAPADVIQEQVASGKLIRWSSDRSYQALKESQAGSAKNPRGQGDE